MNYYAVDNSINQFVDRVTSLTNKFITYL